MKKQNNCPITSKSGKREIPSTIGLFGKDVKDFLDKKINAQVDEDLSPKNPVAIKKPQELSLKKTIIAGEKWRKV